MERFVCVRARGDGGHRGRSADWEEPLNGEKFKLEN